MEYTHNIPIPDIAVPGDTIATRDVIGKTEAVTIKLEQQDTLDQEVLFDENEAFRQIQSSGEYESLSPRRKDNHKAKMCFGKKREQEAENDKRLTHRHGEHHKLKKAGTELSQKEKDQKHIRSIRRDMRRRK